MIPTTYITPWLAPAHGGNQTAPHRRSLLCVMADSLPGTPSLAMLLALLP
jgi:hypothetical protein